MSIVMNGLEFTNLPLVEVSVRLFFADFLPLSLGLVSKASGALGERFPLLDDLDSLEPSAVRIDGGPRLVTLPGAKFHGRPTGVSVSLQTDLLAIRWLRRFGPEAPQYPRFAALEDDLWWAADRLAGVFPQGLPATKAMNMLYANFVPSSDATAERTLGRYFRKDAWIGLVTGSAIFHDLNVSWRSNDGIDRRFFLKHGESQVDGDQAKGFVLGTVAGAEVPAGTSSRERLSSLHGCLQKFFIDLISDDAKKEWGHVQ